jgi:WhiB family redox-sensing transcriptional regulator
MSEFLTNDRPDFSAINNQQGTPDLSWQERALCAQTDPEAFFPEKGGSTREAKRVCLSCDVRSECLEYALGHDERFGIWGGLSERERRRLKRRSA